MKALPKTELVGNMTQCRSVAVVVSRLHQDAESFRSIPRHKQSNTPSCWSAAMREMFISRTSEWRLVGLKKTSRSVASKKGNKDTFRNECVCLSHTHTHTVSITLMQSCRVFDTKHSYFLPCRQQQLQHQLFFFSFQTPVRSTEQDLNPRVL